MIGAWMALAGVLLLATPLNAQPAGADRLRALGLAGYGANERAPGFAAVTAEGHRVSLAALRGKVVLLTFWASWCPPCREEMAAFEGLHRELGGTGLVVIGVNAREDPTSIADYARAQNVSFPLAVDEDGKVGTAYGVVALPTTFLIARDGRAIARAVGSRAWGSEPARALIRGLLSADD